MLDDRRVLCSLPAGCVKLSRGAGNSGRETQAILFSCRKEFLPERAGRTRAFFIF